MSMKSTYIQTHLDELEKTWDFTQEELNDIKERMAGYAVDALVDSQVADEATFLCLIKQNAA